MNQGPVPLFRDIVNPRIVLTTRQLGSRRRSSKASKDGSLRENMAKADIRASPKGMPTSAELRASAM
jgi:hypothetical protein